MRKARAKQDKENQKDKKLSGKSDKDEWPKESRRNKDSTTKRNSRI